MPAQAPLDSTPSWLPTAAAGLIAAGLVGPGVLRGLSRNTARRLGREVSSKTKAIKELDNRRRDAERVISQAHSLKTGSVVRHLAHL